MNANWHLGLATFPCAIDKHHQAVLNITPASTISLSYFSILYLDGNSKLTMNDGSILELKDQSEFSAAEGSWTQLDPGSVISLQSSRMASGTVTLNPGSKLTLSDSKFTSRFSVFSMETDSSVKISYRSQVDVLGGSKVIVGKASNITFDRTFMDVAADVRIGERCNIQLYGMELGLSGTVSIGKKVEITSTNRGAFTVTSSNVTFTEGAKIHLAYQARFLVKEGSSLIMARRDLRLRIEEKAELLIEPSSHCLMTDDLTVAKQTIKTYNSQTNADSFRCYPNFQRLLEEKQRNFPDH